MKPLYSEKAQISDKTEYPNVTKKDDLFISSYLHKRIYGFSHF
jgi:hypothetical protein